MHLVHHSACVFTIPAMTIMPELARTQSGHAPALIPTHEAGRRGGESTARQRTFAHLFSQPERVAVPRRFAMVSVGGAGGGGGGRGGVLSRSGGGVRKSRPEAAEISHFRCRGCNF
ncbi:hypothetical protein FD804_12105 [Klebsiella pneumoniae]|nr:hypothetical protein [Klebsiella pneumoniae]